MKNNEPKTISLSKSFSIFMIAGIQFYVVIKIIVPWLSKCLNTTEYIVWMFAGTFLLFIPIFSTAILLLKRDGYAMDFKTIKSALNLHKLSKKDYLWIIIGLVIAGSLCCIIILLLMSFSRTFTVESLYSISPIAVSPLYGNELWYAVFLPVFFFFNYVGEEILWRGYILPRQLNSNYGKYAVLINALFHCSYHYVFGIKPLIIMFPMLVLMPLIVSKTKNTWTSIIIHTLIGAPTQIMIILGVLGN